MSIKKNDKEKAIEELEENKLENVFVSAKIKM